MATILIVEDMAVFREPIAMAIEHQGHKAVQAANGQEGLVAVSQHHPQLVLLDVAMPVMDGLEFLKALRADEAHTKTPVILLTAVGERDYVVRAAKLGARDYLLKSSFSLQELMERIEHHLSGKGEVEHTPGQAPKPEGAAPTPKSKPAPAPGAFSPDNPNAISEAPVTKSVADHPALQGIDLDGPDYRSHERRVESLKQLTPILSRTEVKQYIDACEEVHGFSPSLMSLLKTIRNPNCTIDLIVKLASSDHGLALKLLKLANSAAFARGEPVDSVRKAIVRIGMGKLRDTALALGVVEHFSSERYGGLVHLGEFWEHSISCGLISAHLATAVGNIDPDAAFTMGLLHDLGRLVMIQQLGDHYDQVMEMSRLTRLPLEQVEGRMLLFTHADVLDRALHTWQFPRNIISPVVFHHLSANNLRIHARKYLTESTILVLANRLSHAMLLGSSGNDFIYPTEELCDILKIDESVIQEIEHSVPEHTTDLKLSLLNSKPEWTWATLRDRLMEKMDPEACPIFVSAKPTMNAVRMLCGRLSGEQDQLSEPNIVIGHVANPAELNAFLRDVEKCEKSEGIIQPLPVVLISSKGMIKLNDRQQEKRKWTQLPQPLDPWALVEAINDILSPEPIEVDG